MGNSRRGWHQPGWTQVGQSPSSGTVPNTRLINTTAPLTGGGALSSDLTLAIPAATDAVNGYLTSTDHQKITNAVQTSRTVSTSAPLTGGGNLSANLTLGLSLGSGLSLDGSNNLQATLTVGLAGGQTVIGDTGASGNLTLTSTSNGTKGTVRFGGSTGLVYDEVNKLLGVGKTPDSVNNRVIDATSGGSAIYTFACTNAAGNSQVVASSTAGAPLLQGFGGSAVGTQWGLTKANSAWVILGTNAGGLAIIGSSNTADVLFAANQAEAFRIDQASTQLKIAAVGVAANGTGTVTTGNLAPGTTAVTIQEWWTVKTAGGTRRIPLYG